MRDRRWKEKKSMMRMRSTVEEKEVNDELERSGGKGVHDEGKKWKERKSMMRMGKKWKEKERSVNDDDENYCRWKRSL